MFFQEFQFHMLVNGKELFGHVDGFVLRAKDGAS